MDEVEGLIEELKHSNAESGWNVLNRLSKFNDGRAVPLLINALKTKGVMMQQFYVVAALGNIGDARAVPALIEELKDGAEIVQWEAARALERIVKRCKTIEDFEEFEKGIKEGSAVLRKGRIDKRKLINLQTYLAKLTRRIADMKDELAPKRDLLLDDKPKPPKKGRGPYQVSRRAMNG